MSDPICVRCKNPQLDKYVCITCFKEIFNGNVRYDDLKGYPVLKMNQNNCNDCTYKVTGTKFHNQPHYHCANCYPGDYNHGVCFNCAKECQEKIMV